jgi:hypothetical protein
MRNVVLYCLLLLLWEVSSHNFIREAIIKFSMRNLAVRPQGFLY